MRILYHHRTQAGDAQGIHIYEMVKAFQDLGHQVDMVALVELDGKGERKTRGVSWEWVRRCIPQWTYELMGLAYNLYGYCRLCRSIRVKRPDLIYERYALNTFCGIWASRRFGIPLVLEVNAPLYYEQTTLGTLAFKRLALLSERWICSNSTWTIVVSKVMRDLLVQEGVADRKIVVMPNGIDPEKFYPGVCGQGVRHRYGLEGKVVVGFVGWFRRWHGLAMLLEIVRQGHLAEQGVRLLLVGDGPAYPELYHYVEKHHLESVVIFTGPVKRLGIPAYIAAMDIAVQPNVTEYACPMKILEYMGMGRCIVAPDQPNIREILEDGLTGFLFQAGDKESLWLTLLALLDNRAKREAAGRKALEHVLREGFFWRVNAQKTLGLVFGQIMDNPIPKAAPHQESDGGPLHPVIQGRV